MINYDRKTDKYIFFWNTIYSQWFIRPRLISENGIFYQNAEKYMMAKKAELFKDDEILQQILRNSKPKIIKSLGRQVKNFDENVWNEHKLDIVTRGNYLKFTQNKDLLEIMIKDKDYILVEASPYDKIWGIGLHFDDDDVLDENKWKGQNLLGKCIMKAREQILKELKI